MKTQYVYLAGPINGQTFDGAVGWRQQAAERFLPHIKARSPMRGKDYLKDMVAAAGGRLNGHEYREHALSTTEGVLTRDRYDVRTSDLILMNLVPATETGVISIGTLVELGWADAFRVPVVLVMDPGNPHEHLFTKGLAGWRLNNLDDGIDFVNAILG